MVDWMDDCGELLVLLTLCVREMQELVGRRDQSRVHRSSFAPVMRFIQQQ